MIIVVHGIPKLKENLDNIIAVCNKYSSVA